MDKIHTIVYETVKKTHLGYFNPDTTRELGGKALAEHLEYMTLKDARKELANLYQCVIDIALELKEKGMTRLGNLNKGDIFIYDNHKYRMIGETKCYLENTDIVTYVSPNYQCWNIDADEREFIHKDAMVQKVEKEIEKDEDIQM